MTAEPEVDRVARLLMAEWERVEGKAVTVSYIATFADMARLVIADRRDQEALVHARWHRALDHPGQEPEGPIRDHIDQVLGAAQAAASDAQADLDRCEERLWRLADKAGWTPGNPADNNATAELYITQALDRFTEGSTA